MAPLQAPERFEYSLSVNLVPGASRAETEALYGGKIVVWRPEADFAVLGLQTDGGLQTLEVTANKSVFAVPEVVAASVDSGGRSTWSGGRSTWSGGRSVWSGGKPTTFTENLGYWNQVDLPAAQRLAPRLGAGVTVAFVDPGIDMSHHVFGGRLAPRRDWRDFVDGDDYPQEVPGPNYGHGTGVADLVVQVAPNVTLLPLRVLGPDSAGDTTAVVAAIDYAVQHGAAIINLSLCTDTSEKALKNLVAYAAKQNVLVVASAGNGGREGVTFPAHYKKEVIGIGSVNGNDELSSFSSYGRALRLTAPGKVLYTAAPDRQVVAWSGTSFATPIVTGALALALGERPSSGLTASDLAKKMTATAEDVHDRGVNKTYKADQLGKGRLDIDDFLKAVLATK
ncbi:hypothetical protein BH24DEI2_BH24DEI2_03950 [soil metagenome]